MNIVSGIHGNIYVYEQKFMHLHMYHEYESVYEYGSNAFELLLQALPLGISYYTVGQYISLIILPSIMRKNMWEMSLSYSTICH